MLTPEIKKAGIIPFIITDGGVVEMLFMVSSDPKFGGPDPMCSKGHIDPGETPEQAAIREGIEELGLKESNFAGEPYHLMDQEIQGLCNSYGLRMYAVQVKSKEDFDEPHYETERTEWMTWADYYQKGRKNQQVFVSELVNRESLKELQRKFPG